MNDILHIKGTFDHNKNTAIPGQPQLSTKNTVSFEHLYNLYNDLIRIVDVYSNSQNKLLKNILISAYYNKVAAKSNRTSVFFTERGKSSNETIVGAKFSDIGNHIITHYVTMDSILKSISLLGYAIQIAKDNFKNPITASEFNPKEKFNEIDFDNTKISKNKFQQLIVDCSYIDKFDIELAKYEMEKDAVVTFYKTELSAKDILTKLNMLSSLTRIVNNTTVILRKSDIDVLLDNVPYLVSMAVDDLHDYSPEDFIDKMIYKDIFIPDPKDEPTIGVIDTLFNENVYFKKWVDYREEIDKELVEEVDRKHGTMVSSIIVDGPRLNPDLDDGCGRFKVRHFGVAKAGKSSSISIMKAIKKIVSENSDIRVWNLSLGSSEEINRNFISLEAETLDQLQYAYNIIFVISGTNDMMRTLKKKIGAPADSINSIVVNTVDKKQNIASYSRKGPVLDFFTKPDVCYYGGTPAEPIKAYGPNGEVLVNGTSFAAPWISRKLSYLIDVLRFDREIAKALIIDSAIGWNYSKSEYRGHGIVPIKITDIVKTPKDEIRFVLSGISRLYDTYNYRFPIPFYDNEYTFVSRATLCYFPNCSRNQGVDYTNNELDIYFGRINQKGKLQSIDKNVQSLDEGPVTEEISRREFGKWDNIKHLQDKYSDNVKGKKVYPSKLWGMRIISKDRLGYGKDSNIRFGVVVTLKDIYGQNRIDDFIQLFSLNGWIVNRINVENRIELYEKAEEIIDLDN